MVSRIAFPVLLTVMVAACQGRQATDRDQTDTVMVFTGRQGEARGYMYAPELREILRRAETRTHPPAGISSANVLIAILATPGNTGLKTLETLRLDLHAFEASLERVEASQAGSSRQGSYTRSMQRALESAMNEGAAARDTVLTAIDLLLGVVANADSSTRDVLKAFSIDMDRLRAAASNVRGGA